MKILMVSSEAYPFAMTGGLAEMTSSLAKALRKTGHDVRVAMPFYRCVEREDVYIRKGRKSVEPVIGGAPKKGLLRQSLLGDIPVYLLENREYFGRKGLYGDEEGDYPDNARRFAFFCRGVLDLLKRMDFRPDVIHCHDWQTALIPYLLKFELERDPFYEKSATVFTIHNLAYQGLFPEEALADMGLDQAHFGMDRLEFYGKVNLLTGGVLGADMVTTVSERYAAEVLTPEFGCGMEGVLGQRQGSFKGILNGIDYDEWNPSTDRELAKQYTASTLSGKAAQKKALQKLLGLPQIADVPLIGMVTRLAEQKGIELLLEAMPWLFEQNVQLAVLGTGSRRYLQLMEAAKAKGRDKLAIDREFNPSLSHRIFAGSDLFLMPSHYEPCGIGQLIAFRYGSVPVVRRTGGLADTVIDKDDNSKDYNGFVFDEFTSEALKGALKRACEAYSDRDAWKKIVRRGMAADFSWSRSARQYEDVYRRALEVKRSG